MSKYAEGTSVPVARSREEITSLLERYKASSIAVGTDVGIALVVFKIDRWHVQFRMPLPTESEARTVKDRRGWTLGETGRQKWLDQTCRERWRALLLTIKAKLVSVENGVETLEEAFLAHLIIPGGQTVGQKALPAIREAYQTGRMPPLLGAGAP